MQDYFNLSFKDAMKKINYDFGLNLDISKPSRQTFVKLEQKKQLKEKQRQEHNKKILYICKYINMYERIDNILKAQITPYNWEYIEETRSFIINRLEMLDDEFERLNVKIY